jgi:hypothetical protein
LQVHTTSVDPAGVLREQLNGRVETVEFSGGSIVVDAPRRGRVYLPGSFNPLHQGHHELLAAACRLRRGAEGCYEMSVGNADKGFMPLPEIERRVAQFVSAGLPVVVTQVSLAAPLLPALPRPQGGPQAPPLLCAVGCVPPPQHAQHAPGGCSRALACSIT